MSICIYYCVCFTRDMLVDAPVLRLPKSLHNSGALFRSARPALLRMYDPLFLNLRHPQHLESDHSGVDGMSSLSDAEWAT